MQYQKFVRQLKNKGVGANMSSQKFRAVKISAIDVAPTGSKGVLIPAGGHPVYTEPAPVEKLLLTSRIHACHGTIDSAVKGCKEPRR